MPAMVTALLKRRCQFQRARIQLLWNQNRRLNGACSVAGMAGSHERHDLRSWYRSFIRQSWLDSPESRSPAPPCKGCTAVIAFGLWKEVPGAPFQDNTAVGNSGLAHRDVLSVS